MNSKDFMTFCTLFDSNYLDRGLALYHSMRKQIGIFRLYIFAFDESCYKVLSSMSLEGVILVPLDEIMTDKLQRIREERTRAEFCWTCTSIVIEHVLLNYKEHVCTYIDADIYFFANPQDVIQEIVDCGCSVGLTPHRFERTYSSIREIYYNGKTCIQFNTFFNNEDGITVLQNWKKDCIEWCYCRYEDGKFGDQKYADGWKMKYSCVHEAEHLGAGLGPWNLYLYSYNGEKDGKLWMSYRGKSFPLIFYHFEGMKFLDRGRVFLNIWQCCAPKTRRKRKKIYGTYINELRTIRKYLKCSKGITFEHMQVDKKAFFRSYSLQYFCKETGLLNGFIQWIAFRVNNVIRNPLWDI